MRDDSIIANNARYRMRKLEEFKKYDSSKSRLPNLATRAKVFLPLAITLLFLFMLYIPSSLAGGAITSEASFATGYFHSVAINSRGRLYGWGNNYNGQLGTGNTTDSSVPLRIGTASNWKEVSAGYYHSAAINIDGELYLWGSNNTGQIGDGSYVDKTSPVRIKPEYRWKFVSCGNFHTLAITSDGSLYAWGSNNTGQLGNGTTIHSTIPIRIGTASNWTTIEAGDYHSFAINTKGELYGWGHNREGQLGDSSNAARYLPTRIAAGHNWLSVSAGMYHSVAVTSKGELYSWGHNYYGQLGNGTGGSQTINPDGTMAMTTDQKGINTPMRIGTASNWTVVRTGDYHSVALNSNGQLYAWGFNGYGQIGNGQDTDTNSPQLIAGDHRWARISACDNHSLAIASEGQLYAWGCNDIGQLGDGSTKNKSFPTPVASSDGLWGGASFHSVSFDSSGGNSIAKQWVAAGNEVGKLPIPIKASYNFAGWWTASTGGIQVNSATRVQEDTLLTARWNPITTTRPQDTLPKSISIISPQGTVPLLEGKTRSLKTKISPDNAANKTVKWKSSNPKVASVDSKGLVKAISPGAAQITATAAASNVSTSATVKVEASPQSLNSSLRTIKMKQGTSLKVPVIVRGRNNAVVPISWKTSNKNVSTFENNKSGGTLRIKQNANYDLNLKAVKPGTTEIVLTSLNGKTITYKVTVQAQSKKLKNVGIGNLPAKNTLYLKKSRDLNIKLAPTDAGCSGKVQWASSKPQIASIDQAGRVTARKKGKTNITLRVGNKASKVTLTVK